MTKCRLCGHYYANKVCYYCNERSEREAEARAAYVPDYFSQPAITNEGNLNMSLGGSLGISSDGSLTVGGIELDFGSSNSDSFSSGGGDFGGGGASGDY